MFTRRKILKESTIMLGVLVLLACTSMALAGSQSYGIVDRARGYSADYAFLTGAATITIPLEDIPYITRVVIQAKDPWKPGWIILYDGRASTTIDVSYAGVPLQLELFWRGTLPNGHGRITWADKPGRPGEPPPPPADHGKLPFFEDFSVGFGNWRISEIKPEIASGYLMWHTGNFLSASLDFDLLMEDIVIEFDGWAETNGINVFLWNSSQQGYTIIFGGWYNTQSGSDIGGSAQNRQLVQGSVWQKGKWHHYKIVRRGDLLSATCDDRQIFARTSMNRFTDSGRLRFNSYNAKIGIDNVRIYRSF
ncbi:MAG: hypothetical protein NTX88_11550 [Candidatus Atribacteria bacterium]|nr:hypothetical protein [Candidatus Atribacteria bacterium]